MVFKLQDDDNPNGIEITEADLQSKPRRNSELKLLHIFHHSRQEIDLPENPSQTDHFNYQMEFDKLRQRAHSNLAFYRANIQEQSTSDIEEDDDKVEMKRTKGNQYFASKVYPVRIIQGDDGILYPDPFHFDTAVALSTMCFDAYQEQTSPTWLPVENFPSVSGF